MEDNLDLRIRKTYLSLQNAFVDLLEEKRFDELTVNELCQRAMIRRTTFYKHFADKYEYFAFFIQEMVSNFRQNLALNATNPDIAEYFLQMCQELLQFYRLHENMVRNIRSSSMFPVLLSILLEQLTQDMVQILRHARPDLAKNTDKLKGVAAFYTGGLLSTFFHCIREDSSINEAMFLEIVAEYASKIPT